MNTTTSEYHDFLVVVASEATRLAGLVRLVVMGAEGPCPFRAPQGLLTR